MEGDPQMLFESAEAALRNGRVAEARELCQRVLELDPERLLAKHLRAAIATREGDSKLAERLLTEILDGEPDSFDALTGLAILRRSAGQHSEALELAQKAVRLRSELPFAHLNLGRCALAARQSEEAIVSLDRAISLEPKFAAAFQDRGRAYQIVGRAKEAADDYRQAIALAPNSIGAHVGLGQLLLANGNAEGAVVCFRRAAELDPRAPAGKVQLARALIEEGSFEEAEACLREALAVAPGFAEAHALLGRMLQQLGRFDEARSALELSIALQPARAATYYTLMNGRKIVDEDRPLVSQAEELSRAENLSLEERRTLHYALGKAYEDLGEYERAMGHFEAANREALSRLHGAGRVFDRARHASKADEAIAVFSREFFEARAFDGEPSGRPVFIVGMARSGTTLLEQIVSSHPMVGAAGELGFWLHRTGSIPSGEIAGLAASEFRALGAEYVELLERKAPGRSLVTDKMPQNFAVLGPIHLSLPNAKVIHCRRSPIDTCLSIFTTSFNAGPDFAHDRDDLVFAYREYLRLMAHWRTVLPGDRFLEVDYEELVASPETLTRRIVTFLGLEWSDACLRHESNAHAISTPSLWQARQPVYGSSVERWRRFEPWLGSLRQLARDGEA